MVLGVADIPEGVAMWPQVTPVLSVAVGLSVMLRRRQPLLLTLAGFGLHLLAAVASGLADQPAELTFGLILGMSLLVHTVVRWAPWPQVGAALVAVVLTQAGAESVRAGGSLVTFADNGVFWTLAVTIGFALRYRAASIRLAARQVRHDERERIARDLHDVVAHHVSGIAIQAEGARALSATDPVAAAAVLDSIHDAASQALLDMRRTVAVLRDDADEVSPSATGSLVRLQELAASPAGPPTVSVSLPSAPVGAGPAARAGAAPPIVIPRAVDDAAYGIALEAVTNARRHAHGAQEVRVQAVIDGAVLRLSVIDDGSSTLDRTRPTGPGSDDRPGYGLRGMYERATLVGGSLRAGPRPRGPGWRVEAELPLDGPETDR